MMIINNAIFPLMKFVASVLETACMDAHHKRWAASKGGGFMNKN